MLTCDLDPLIHEPARLLILCNIHRAESSFTELRDGLSLTDGNLSIHIKKLEAAGYIAVEKSFVDRRPKTVCSITPSGQTALSYYFVRLKQLLVAVGMIVPEE